MGCQHVVVIQEHQETYATLCHPSSPDRQRLTAQVYFCTEPNWGGSCEVFSFGINQVCYQVPGPYYEHVGSAGPDPGATCQIFSYVVPASNARRPGSLTR